MLKAMCGVAGLLGICGVAGAQQAKFLDVVVTTDDGDSIVEEGESALICLYVQMTPPDDEVLCGFAAAVFDTVNEQNGDTGKITSFGCLNSLCDFDTTTTDGVNLFNTQLGQLAGFGQFSDDNPIGVYQFKWETEDYSQRVVKYRTKTETMRLWMGDCDAAEVVDAGVMEADISFCVGSCTPFEVPDQLWGLPHEGGGVVFGFDKVGNPGFQVQGDGSVLIGLGDVDYHMFEFDPAAMGDGSLLSVIPHSTFPGGAPEPLWKHIVKVDGGASFHFFDTSPVKPESIMLVAKLLGKPVDVYMCDGCNFDSNPAFVVTEAIGCIETPFMPNADWMASLMLGAPTMVKLPESEVMADQLEMHVINPTKPISPLGIQTLIVCEGFEFFTLVEEAIGKFGNIHVAHGSMVQGVDGVLEVSGQAPDDGLELRHKPAEFVEVGFELKPADEDQAFVVFEPTVHVQNANNLKQLGLAMHNYVGNSWSLKPDFAAIADETNVVQCDVMFGDNLIKSIKGIVADPPQVFIMEPTGLSYLAALEETENHRKLGQQILSDSSFLVMDRFGNPIGTANRVRFALVDQLAEVDSIDSTGIRAAFMEALLITSEKVVPAQPGCFADCDANGALNILDFVCYQNLFVTGDLGADCDGNGALNILDFVCYQNAFVEGCP
jgi:hypothetical protein